MAIRSILLEDARSPALVVPMHCEYYLILLVQTNHLSSEPSEPTDGEPGDALRLKTSRLQTNVAYCLYAVASWASDSGPLI